MHKDFPSATSNVELHNLSREELIAKIRAYQRQIELFREEQRRLNTLFAITRSLSQELDLDNLLHLLMDEVKETLQADRCTVFLIDEERGELWSRVGHGLENFEIRFPKSKGIAGYVATTGEVLKIDDCYSDPRFNPEIDRKTGYRTRNLLTVPMRNKMREIIGVFQVLNKKTGPFTDADVRLLEAIAPIAAVQIENAQLYEELRRTFDSLISTLAHIVDARDPQTAGHSHRIMLYADEIARIAGWSKRDREVLRISALLHDLGKIGIREHVLTKSEPLTEEEYEHVRQHVELTKSILQKIHFSRRFKDIPLIAASHHERLDGSGYPDGLVGEEIPAGGRILAIADMFDAMTSRRHYRDRLNFVQVVRTLKEAIGRHLDPYYVNCFFQISLGRLLEIMEFEEDEWVRPADLKWLKNFTLGELARLFEKEADWPEWALMFLRYYETAGSQNQNREE